MWFIYHSKRAREEKIKFSTSKLTPWKIYLLRKLGVISLEASCLTSFEGKELTQLYIKRLLKNCREKERKKKCWESVDFFSEKNTCWMFDFLRIYIFKGQLATFYKKLKIWSHLNPNMFNPHWISKLVAFQYYNYIQLLMYKNLKKLLSRTMPNSTWNPIAGADCFHNK